MDKVLMKTYTIPNIDDLDEIKHDIESKLGIKVKRIEIEDSFDDIGEYGINVLFGNGCECVFFKDNILILLTVGKSQSLISCVDDYISLELS